MKLSTSILLCSICAASDVVMGCSKTEAPVQPDYFEVVVADACLPGEFLSHSYMLADDAFVVTCQSPSTRTTSTIYRFDRPDYQRQVIYEGPFQDYLNFPSQIAGDTMYAMFDAGPIQALRLDTGPAIPSPGLNPTGDSSRGFLTFVVSGAYIYWTWGTNSEPPTFGLSRTPLSGGSEELIATLPTPPSNGTQTVLSNPAVLGDNIYVNSHTIIPHPDGTDSASVSIFRFSGSQHEGGSIFDSDEPVANLFAPFFSFYQDHILWGDNLVQPAVTYDIIGSTVQLDSSVKCAPIDNSVIFNNMMLSPNVSACVPGSQALTSTDLTTGEIGYALGPQFPVSLMGSEAGWLYAGYNNNINRLLLTPFP